MSTPIDQSNIVSQPVQNHLLPDEGPRAIPVILDFTATVAAYSLDLTNVQARGGITMVQTIYVDASAAGAAPLTIQVGSLGGGGQTIIIKPNTQGYFNILCPNPAKITFQSTPGTVRIPIVLINVSIPGHSWSTV